ncbi:MAG: MotA/TolQ/ExbB proton channel family protein [Planctomycetota bacterium]|jgi:biopolymer transport protein ExbB
MESYQLKQDKYQMCCAGPFGAKKALWAVMAAFSAALASPASAAGLIDAFALDPDTKTFFFQFVVAGGPIVWVILLPMSVVTGYLAIDLAISIRRSKLLPADAPARIAAAARNPGFGHLPAKLKDSADLLSCTLSAAIVRSKQANDNHKQLHRFAADALQTSGMQILRKVEWCNVIGSVAPMVGLFGTVFGMIKAFNLLGISGGQPRPDQLAAAISIALITTFWGLLVAIPALVMGGIFRTRTETLLTEAAIELETLLAQITPPTATHPQPARQSLSLQKVPIREVTIGKKTVAPTKPPLRPQPVQTQAVKPNGKRKYPPAGPAPGRKQFPAKPAT